MENKTLEKVYELENSKVEIHGAFILELISLIASITNWLFKAVQKLFTPMKRVVHLPSQALIYVKNDLKIDVEALNNIFIKNIGAVITYLDSGWLF